MASKSTNKKSEVYPAFSSIKKLVSKLTFQIATIENFVSKFLIINIQ